MQPKGRMIYGLNSTGQVIPIGAQSTAIPDVNPALVSLYDPVSGLPVFVDFAELAVDVLDVNSYALLTKATMHAFDVTSQQMRPTVALSDNTDAQAVNTTRACPVLINRNYGFNGTTWDRLRSFANNADALAVSTLGTLGVSSFSRAFNGTTYDRLRTTSAATVSATTQPFNLATAHPGEWSINHTPAANTQATITRAAGAAGVRHVCRSITVTLIGLAAAAEATVLVNLRDGATGAGTILWSARLLVQGTVGRQETITLSNLNYFGTAATAMTLEFAAAGGANTFETVAVSGYDTI